MDEYQGLVSYSDALGKQNAAFEDVAAKKITAKVLGLEHEPVICLGRRSTIEKDLLKTKDFYSQKGYDLQRVDRGGLASIHNPGQIVIYPVVDLSFYNLGIKDFVCTLLKVSQATLTSFGLTTNISTQQDGLFYKEAKLAFVGLRLKQNISYHGIAVNLNNDLSMYKHIYACGIKSAKITSTKEQGLEISCEEFYRKWLELFRQALKLN